MTLQFLDTTIFPDSVSNGASGGPTFSTNVFTGNTGIEQRGIGWPRCRHKYKVDLGIRTDGDMEAARLIMFDILGKGIGFRFKDWADFRLTNENIGTGDGSTLVFNITKTYTAGALSYVRRIFKPVTSGLKVYVNGVLKTLTTDYTVEGKTGVITFVAAPSMGHAVTVTGEFHVPVRLDTDEMQSSHIGYQAQEWKSIPLIEVLATTAEFLAA